jgi:predicted ester cyclase
MESLESTVGVPDGRELVRLYVEGFINRRDAAIAELILSPDFVYHGPNGPASSGRDSYLRRSFAFLEAFPDWRGEVCDVVADGDMVSDRVHITATHTASINGVPPSGEVIDDDCAHLWRLQDGVAVEGWLFCNARMLAVMRLASSGR